MLQFTASQIAQLIQGKVEGDPAIAVHSFGKIEEAVAGQLSFLANPKYEEHIYQTQASVIIVNDSFQPREKIKATLIRVADAYSAFATLLTKYQEFRSQQLTGIEQPSFIAASAQVACGTYIGAFSYIGEQVIIGEGTKIYPNTFVGEQVKIGRDCVIHPGVKIYHECVIGDQVIIHAGTVIGSDGFGFAPQADGSLQKVPQIGNVVIESGVEIGANTTIDRATIGSTIIRKGAKLDNLIQVAHNVEIGNSTVIAAQTGISGSTKIGKGVMIGGQAGVVGHITIGDGAKVNAQSGVIKSLAPGKAVSGTPATDYTQSLRSQAVIRRLPELEKRIQELEKIIKDLQSNS